MFPRHITVFVVGGAVRDTLLGRPVKDLDYVVVGATPQEMLDLGFTQVGADFPVFLHPETREEYALARTERKTGKGYHGFSTSSDPSVTLEDDLRRRDLTINAMAVALEDWDAFIAGSRSLVFDPFDGRTHMFEGRLHPVSEAFSEDPVRVLRAARFAARFGFKASVELRQAIKALVVAGELDHLVPERIWQETEKALSEPHFMGFFQFLHDVGAFDTIFPIFIWDSARAQVCPAEHLSLPQRWALACTLFCPEGQAAAASTSVMAPKEFKRHATAALDLAIMMGDFLSPQAAPALECFLEHGMIKSPEFGIQVLNTIRVGLPCWIDVEENEKLLDLFARAIPKMAAVTFASLSPEEQSTLKGPDIGAAIAALQLAILAKEMFMSELKGAKIAS